jgi:hypothetical protein
MSTPPTVVPICSVVWPGVPLQTFFSSIAPRLRVFVIEHTTSSPVPTWTTLSVPTETDDSSPSLTPLFALEPAPLSLKQV